MAYLKHKNWSLDMIKKIVVSIFVLMIGFSSVIWSETNSQSVSAKNKSDKTKIYLNIHDRTGLIPVYNRFTKIYQVLLVHYCNHCDNCVCVTGINYVLASK